jgi:outer membrane lipoprotein-sorting protein
MSIRPASSNRAGMQTAGVRLVCASFAILLAAGLPNTASADSAKDVLARMAATYNKAKTYQGSVVTKQSGKGPDGKFVSVTTTMQIKYLTPNLFNLQVTATGTGIAAKSAGQNNRQQVSDGKTVYTYSPVFKQYKKEPAGAQIPLNKILPMLQGIESATEQASLLPEKTVHGHPAFVVSFTPKMQPNMTAEQKKQFQELAKTFKFHLMIDKKSYQLLQAEQYVASPQGSLTTALDMNSQVIGGNISKSIFKFTPPAGSKEATASPAGAGGAPNPHGAGPGPNGVPGGKK